MAGASQGGPVRRRVIFSGRVQGVFFRATSQELSRGYRVTGYVRNRPDGTVELEAEGPPDQVDAFVQAVTGHFRGYIARTQSAELPARGNEAGFEVHY